jgi:Lar family restriction alleviation protein
MSEFLPCPFCGSSDIEVGWSIKFRREELWCDECGAKFSDPTSTKAELIASWNRRAALSQANPPSTPPEGREQNT